MLHSCLVSEYLLLHGDKIEVVMTDLIAFFKFNILCHGMFFLVVFNSFYLVSSSVKQKTTI